MCRIFIDVCVFGVDWFAEICGELTQNENVRFAFSPVSKLLGEHERTVKALFFYKQMREMGRVDIADPDAVQSTMDILEANSRWKSEKDCDDPHIFAIHKEKPVKYVITTDGDIANCRSCMIRIISRSYCNFKLICNKGNYYKHRHIIVKP